MATYNITGYFNSSDRNEINKILSEPLFTVAGNFKKETDIVRPVVTLSSHASDFSTCNYLYIEQFHRYYFIENKVIDTQGNITLSCVVDVLMSHRERIKELNVIALRSSKDGTFNIYQVDDEVPRLAKQVVATQKFPNGFRNTDALILAVNGTGGGIV